jgi:hypothetical protein
MFPTFLIYGSVICHVTRFDIVSFPPFAFGNRGWNGGLCQIINWPPFALRQFRFELGNIGWNVGLCQATNVNEVVSPTIVGQKQFCALCIS